MPITREQCRMARAFLDLSLREMHEFAKVSRNQISNFETGAAGLSVKNLQKLKNFFESRGLEFTKHNGVQYPERQLILLKGRDWFVNLLTDAHRVLKDEKNPELLIYGGNNRVSPPGVIEEFRRLKQAGVTIREMVKDGDLYLHNDEWHYRWIPIAFYRNMTNVIYANKVCVDFDGSGALLVSQKWADAEREKFEYMWSISKKIEGESIAPERF